MTDDRELDALRRDARALLNAFRSGDAGAHARAATVLGDRADERFVLADALHVVAREQGAGSWPDLVARARRGAVRAALEDTLDVDDRAEIDVETGVVFPDGSPLVVTVRQRGRRFLLEDGGESVRRAGSPSGWAAAAEQAVRRSGMNVSASTGAVFVPAVGARDLDDLAARLARASLEVYEALVELE